MVTVIVAEFPIELLTEVVTPVGAVTGVVPALVEYHCTVPVSPSGRFDIETEKVAEPTAPEISTPFCAPTFTTCVPEAKIVNVATAEAVEFSFKEK